jgi:hypothetical protein
MKNLIKTSLMSGIAILLSTAFLSASAYSPHCCTKSQNKGYSLKPEVTPFGSFDFKADFTIAIIPEWFNFANEARVTYIVAGNDRKPDNINIQIWRKKILNLRTSMRDC